MPKRRQKIVTAMATGAAALLLLSACGSPAPAGTSASAGADGLTDITVALLPIMDLLPLHLAIEEGIFEKHGLHVEAVPAQGGAGLVPAVLEGSVDIGSINPSTYVLTRERGLPLEVAFAAGMTERADAGHPASTLVVAGDSPYDSPADLNGATVAVNNVKSIQEIAVRNSVDKDGGDSSTVELTELPQAQALAAIDAGRVDAASLNEPFTTIAINSGYKVLSSPFNDLTGETANMVTYVTNGAFAQANPDALEAFRAAMLEANEVANGDMVLSRKVIQGYTDIEPEVLADMAIFNFEPTIRAEAIRTVVQKSIDYGVMEKADTLDESLATIPNLEGK